MKRKEYISPVSFSKNFEALRYLIFTLMLQLFSVGKKDIVFIYYVGIAGKVFFLGKYAAADFIPGIKAAGFFSGYYILIFYECRKAFWKLFQKRRSYFLFPAGVIFRSFQIALFYFLSWNNTDFYQSEKNSRKGFLQHYSRKKKKLQAFF